MKKAKMGTDKAFVKEVIQVIYQIAYILYTLYMKKERKKNTT